MDFLQFDRAAGHKIDYYGVRKPHFTNIIFFVITTLPDKRR